MKLKRVRVFLFDKGQDGRRPGGCLLELKVGSGGQPTLGVVIRLQSEPNLLEIVGALGSPGRLACRLDGRKSSAIRMPMIAITTSSSTNVKPSALRAIPPIRTGAGGVRLGGF